MNVKHFGKLLLVASISVGGIATLTSWYRKANGDITAQQTNEKPVGYLKSGTEGIERRPGARLVWQALNGSEQVFTGDAIRTSAKADGSVYLDESKITIMLEPDSLIVIETSKDTFTVGLIEGGLAVKQEIVTEKNGDKSEKKSASDKKQAEVARVAVPVIKAAGTTLALGSSDAAELNLSINKKNEVALSVTKGSVDMVKGNQKVAIKEGTVSEIKKGEIVKTDVIGVIEPKPGTLIDIGGKGEIPVTFRWQPFSRKLPVSLKIGDSRSTLKELAVTSNLVASSLSVPLAVGTFFWQLVAIDPATHAEAAQSPVYRNQTITLSAPELIAPAKDAKFFIGNDAMQIPVSWSLPPFVDRVALFIARDNGFKDLVVAKWFTSVTSYSFEMSQPGTYYAKVIAAPEGFDRKWPSAVHAFTLSKLRDVAAPHLTAPAEGASLPVVSVQASGLFVEWGAVDGASQYLVALTKGGHPVGNEPLTTNETEYRLTQPASGQYTCKVQAIGMQGQKSSWSAVRNFTLLDLALVPWISTFDSYEYETEEASVPLAWESGPAQTKSWRLNYTLIHESHQNGPKKIKEVSGNSLTLDLPEDGTYEIVVQALDGKKQIIGGTKRKQIEVLPITELPAPVLKIDAKGELVAGGDGSIALSWTEVKGAIDYLIKLDRVANNKLYTYHTGKTQIKLKELLPGSYKLQVFSVNKRKRPSVQPAQKVIIVPESSNIAPPMVGKINIR